MFPNGNISSIIPVDSDGVERLSTATDIIFNNTKFQKRSASVTSINFPVVTNQVPGYRFIRGRESGSFYLKVGMAAFCFGHIIHEGLMLSQQIYYLSSNEKYCLDIARFILYIVRPLYSFYQLFMLFKYSNLVINRHLPLAQFGIMHLIGTSATFWLGAILDDAVEYLENKVTNKTASEYNSTCDDLSCILPDHLENRVVCSRIALPSNKYDTALPYLYPFAIEFNLILAALWFVVWKNIGKDSHTAHPHHFQHKVCQDLDGNEDVCFESNLVIRADCHASNKGLFGGMFILLLGLITMILFFVSVHTKGYERIAVYIFTSQELVVCCLIGIVSVVAFKQMQKLNINPYKNSSHTLDILLLMIPLPFYFLNNILSIRSDIAMENWSSVLLQTVFISTTMHRCSNDRQLRFLKPGRELITLMILLNISLWIISTFESKAVEKHTTQPAYYGSIMWMVISHTTLPLMFHATVCLADIWKFAYEKAHL
ncbi:Otopetrin-1-like protein [Leptotrombidium deliense]|uniref:Otopetrin-1-like protein n=1 Tax=Leptotrombidium deliense TaxID=299467 RepID=A0A443STB5_9ACAR|nr:Otopetrin-1-like protein [Leptotrombidium deliense]